MAGLGDCHSCFFLAPTPIRPFCFPDVAILFSSLFLRLFPNVPRGLSVWPLAAWNGAARAQSSVRCEKPHKGRSLYDRTMRHFYDLLEDDGNNNDDDDEHMDLQVYDDKHDRDKEKGAGDGLLCPMRWSRPLWTRVRGTLKGRKRKPQKKRVKGKSHKCLRAVVLPA